MQASKETVREMEQLLTQYSKTIEELEHTGLLRAETAKTYLTHSTNFVRWCKGDFEPGGRNIKK